MARKIDHEILEALTNLNVTIGEQNKDRRADENRKEQKKEHKSAVRTLKANTKEVLTNTAGIFGLTKSMFTLGGVMGDLKGMNSMVSKSLVKVQLASEGSSKTLDRFNDSSTGLQQQIGTFADAVDLGMSNFSDGTLKFSAQLKAQGINNKASMGLMRQNTQALGLSEEASLTLMDSLVSTAAQNGDSISGLISALESMKDAMISTTVALGPEAAANAEKVAAMMSQSNSELQGASAEFVASFLSGSEGYAKAAKLGVIFTGKETDMEMAAKFDQLMEKITTITGGMKGPGSQQALAAFSEGFGLSMQDINLAQQLEHVSWARQLVEGNTEQRQQELSKISVEQAHANATRNTQKAGLTVMEGIASSINKLGMLAGGYLIGIVGGVATMVGALWSILTAVQAIALMRGKSGAMDMLSKGKGRGGGRVGGASRTMRAGVRMTRHTNKYIKALGRLTVASTQFGGKLAKMVKGFGSKMWSPFKAAGKGIAGFFGKGGLGRLVGTAAKGFGKILGPLAAVATGVQKGIQTGSWIEGLKRGAVSAAIWGVGAALAPVTGGASLLGAAALDVMAGDMISDALPGGVEEKAEEKKQTTKNLAKQTQVSMMELGVTKDAGFSEDELARIADNTQKNLEFNEQIKNMTEKDLQVTLAQLEEAKATPITMLSNYLAQNLVGMSKMVEATDIGNAQRETQTEVIESNNRPKGPEPITAGALR